MYKVLKAFNDLQDEGNRYEKGDRYPRKGYRPTKERIEELSGASNRQGVPLIKEIPEETKKKR